MMKTKTTDNGQETASFRDPSGFLFVKDGGLFRQINKIYQPDYDFLMSSGLYEKLVASNLLVPHAEVNIAPLRPAEAYKIIAPERMAFISYPYEWAFSQLKDAALATLKIQKIALRHGMTLKDASAYNIQFQHGQPVLIDTLSFETHKDGEPWVAYKQFCQHFLAPLALMAKKEVRLGQLLRNYIDGIPLGLASCLLPFSTRLNFGLLTHLHIHAQAQARYANRKVEMAQLNQRVSRQILNELILQLESVVKQLEWKYSQTEWANYYGITNYTDPAFQHKKEVVTEWVKRASPQSVWDLGANNGEFTRLASKQGIPSIAFDIDFSAVEQNYRQIKRDKEQNLLPLLLDLTNPSPALGWQHCERHSLLERGPVEMVFALALIHHLAISNNVPLEYIAKFLSDATSQWIIIEFVPKSDSQVKKLLASRKDIFTQYNQEEFEHTFSRYFSIREKVSIIETERSLYLMEKI